MTSPMTVSPTARSARRRSGRWRPVTMLRISYVGEIGWEITSTWNTALRLWDLLCTPARSSGSPPSVPASTATRSPRKGLPPDGRRTRIEYNPVEAGLARPRSRPDFIGKAAYLEAREPASPRAMCTLTVERPDTSSSGGTRHIEGGNEPILTLDGERILDSHGRVSRVTSAGTGRRSASTCSWRTCLPSTPWRGPTSGDVPERAVPGEGRRWQPTALRPGYSRMRTQ